MVLPGVESSAEVLAGVVGCVIIWFLLLLLLLLLPLLAVLSSFMTKQASLCALWCIFSKLDMPCF